MENSRVPLATHLMQHTLRSLCTDSQWVYAVFWRILPRNFPPPKWETGGGILERRKANKRNWILVWEDGYCDFGACTGRRSSSTMGDHPNTGGEPCGDPPTILPPITGSSMQYPLKPDEGLQPDLFFKMSHDVYNYGEGLMGKVASELGHKWIYRRAVGSDHGNLLSHSPTWNNTLDTLPRTWEAQFAAGIETIALVAVREGLLQLGSTSKVAEDGNAMVGLQKKFNYLQMIPGVLLPHPSSTPVAVTFPLPTDDWKHNLPVPASTPYNVSMDDSWNMGGHLERRLSWNGTSTTLIPPQQQQRPHHGEVAYEELNTTGQGSWPNNAFLNPSLFDALPSSSSANLILENDSTNLMAIADMLNLNPFPLSSLGEMGVSGGYGLIPSESAASSSLNTQQVSCTLNGTAAAAASSSILMRSMSVPAPTERKRRNVADVLPGWWT